MDASAWLQNAISRGVCDVPRPQLALNHWRVSSISEMSAMGTSQHWLASHTRSSKTGSGAESSTPSIWSAATRSPSFNGIAAAALPGVDG